MEYRHVSVFFFFNDTATTEIYTLSLHDALPILETAVYIPIGRPPTRPKVLPWSARTALAARTWVSNLPSTAGSETSPQRSEEHTSELQSRQYLVCRLLLEKKKKQTQPAYSAPSL